MILAMIPRFRFAKFDLLIKREKFAYTEVPYDFMPECPTIPP